MSIKKAYNSWANIYDTNDNKTRDLEKKAALQTLAIYDFKNVLVLGCGTGKNTAWLAEKADTVLGLDFSEGMLTKARAKITAPNVTFQFADLTKPWQVNDQAFDLITCSLTLEHIENLYFICAQAQQKLQGGGKFYLCEYHPFKQYTGKKARYETENGIEELETYVHHTSEYLTAAADNGFKLLELKEWFDGEQEDEMPRLVSFVFEKK